MELLTQPAALSLALVIGMLCAMRGGHRLGRRRAAAGAPSGQGGGAVAAAVFGLLGLLLAFTFSGAAARFEARRELITQECNDLGTAWLRLDLLPATGQSEVRAEFRAYVDSRLRTYALLPDLDAARAELLVGEGLQQRIWRQALSACAAKADAATTSLILSALNAVFDISSTRTAAAMQHPPVVIFVLLFLLVLGCAFLGGYGMAGAAELDWLHVVSFAVIMALCVYVILDLEFPRLGLIRVDDSDQQLIDLRAKMGLS